jgi:flagellar biosynthesis protein FliQ
MATLAVVWSLVVGIIIAIKFASTGITVIAQSTSIKDFIKGH